MQNVTEPGSFSPKRVNIDDQDIPSFLPIPSNHEDFSMLDSKNDGFVMDETSRKRRRTFQFPSFTISLSKKYVITPIEEDAQTVFLPDEIPSDLLMPILNF